DPSVETAYIKPPGEPPAIAVRMPAVKGSTTPDFTQQQLYFKAAPIGVDVNAAWKLRGGRGAGVKIIDCEWAWNSNHEDLAANFHVAIIGTQSGDDDHGTAVAGVIVGNDNGFGITGICPDASLSTACFASDSTGSPTSSVIIEAANKLSPGDILLLE